MNSPVPPVGDDEPAGSFAGSIIASLDQTSSQNAPNRAVFGNANVSDSMGSIVEDVEKFARGWVVRVRRLIHRSTQLVERETLLAGAIGRLNQQQADWTKRTAAKDAELIEQSKLLTEAWLEVEAERRKAIQGARAAITAGKKPSSGPVIAAPVQAVPGSPVVQQPCVSASAGPSRLTTVPVPAEPSPAATPVQPPVAPGIQPAALGIQPAPPVVQPINPAANQTPVGMAPPMQPPIPTSSPTQPQDTDDPDALEAATKERLEEFKRMQRAIRANNNNT